MKKVILTKGLQGSGKTRWAKQMQANFPGQYKRVSKDDIRLMLDNSVWSKGNEKFVLELRDNIISQALRDGKNVIVDDTNLNPVHEEHIRELVKELAEVEIKDFTDVDIETCIKNDAKRENPVGEKIIRQTYKQWLYKKPVKPEYVKGLLDVVICDLDGTLANLNGRNPYDASTCEKDLVNPVVLSLLKNKRVIFVSGREDKYCEQTMAFLLKANPKFAGEPLFMRKTGDFRRDSIVKKEIYENNIKGKYNIEFILDDRLQVCRMWYELGLPIFRWGDPDANF
jgi:predicted kinase